MKIKINFTLLLLLLIAFTASSQTDKRTQTKGFDYGKVENNVYSNSFFNFTFTIPDEWAVQTKEQTDDLIKVGTDLVVGDDDDLKKVVKAAEVNSAYLLTIFKYKVGASVEYNPGMILVAENLKLAPGVKNGTDYLSHVRTLIQRTQLQYDNIDSEFEKINIGNQEFYRMNLVLNHAGLAIKQSYYSTVLNGFSISVIISFIDEDQKNELKKVLHTLKFDQ